MSHALTYKLPSIITNLSSLAEAAVLVATASMRSISAQRRAMAAAYHCCSVEADAAGASICSDGGATYGCCGLMLLELRGDDFIDVVVAGAGAVFWCVF